MRVEYAGYAYLASLDTIKSLELDITCQVVSVQRKEVIDKVIAIPAGLKPAEKVLSQILFALKHEGVNMQILAQALPLVEESDIRKEFDSSPTGKYIRSACFLWEHFTGQTVKRTQQLTQGNYIPLFDPDRYITTQGYKDKRWRIIFNGLGSLDYCITVRRTERLEQALSRDVLQKVRAFTDSLDSSLLNRALSWVYLSETRDSFAIENEVPDSSKMNRFINLLRRAHETRFIDEDYLVYLQNETINNKYDWAASFRTEQNYLSNGMGAIGVTYVPPGPELCRELMKEWLALVNNMPSDVNPLVLGAILSFGFVFIHPFMDGNGRLSRFMFHHVLCQQGSLSNGLILPVSAVLHDKERDYLDALSTYSAKTRIFWDITYIDIDNITLSFQGHEAIYRYWDGTLCAELMAQASEEAMEQYIKREVAHLSKYDTLKRRIDRAFDISDSTLSKLVIFCLEQNGRISNKRRDQYRYSVPEDVFDALEEAYSELFGESEAD